MIWFSTVPLVLFLTVWVPVVTPLRLSIRKSKWLTRSQAQREVQLMFFLISTRWPTEVPSNPEHSLWFSLPLNWASLLVKTGWSYKTKKEIVREQIVRKYFQSHTGWVWPRTSFRDIPNWPSALAKPHDTPSPFFPALWRHGQCFLPSSLTS